MNIELELLYLARKDLDWNLEEIVVPDGDERCKGKDIWVAQESTVGRRVFVAGCEHKLESGTKVLVEVVDAPTFPYFVFLNKVK